MHGPASHRPVRSGHYNTMKLIFVAVSEVVLNEPSIRALIGKGEAPKVS
jgi:hypothetical protein